MDEIDLVRAARPVDSYPAGDQAAARARLGAAMAEAAASGAPELARHSRRPPGLMRRAAIAGALAAAVAVSLTVTQQLSPDGTAPPAAPTANAAELANSAATAAATQSIPTPRPHQWVYTKEREAQPGFHYPNGVVKAITSERWDRADGKKVVYPTSDIRKAHVSEARQLPPSMWCPPGKPGSVRPAVGLARFLRNLPAVPTDPDGLLAAVYLAVESPSCAPAGDTVQERAFVRIGAILETVLPADVRAALYRALAKIPGVTVVQGATDAAGRRGVALARAAGLEGPGSSGWLRVEIILDSDTYRYLGARHVVTRDHFIPGVGGPRGTWSRKGQVLVSRAQLALAIVNAPCQRPGETTTCPSKQDPFRSGRVVVPRPAASAPEAPRRPGVPGGVG